MTRDEAKRALLTGAALELASKDATGTLHTHTAVWLSEDGDLEMAHPTRDRGYVTLLDSQLSGLQLA